MASSKSKQKVLSLLERVKIVERSDKGESCLAIARSLGVGKTRIQSIIREKESIKRRWQAGESGEGKTSKIKKTALATIDDGVWNWFCEARRRNIPVTGRLIQEKALCLSLDEGIDDFQASNGWLSKWMKSRNVHHASLSRERASVSQEALDDWNGRIPSFWEGYSADDIFNADETGLLYRTLPA